MIFISNSISLLLSLLFGKMILPKDDCLGLSLTSIVKLKLSPVWLRGVGVRTHK